MIYDGSVPIPYLPPLGHPTQLLPIFLRTDVDLEITPQSVGVCNEGALDATDRPYIADSSGLVLSGVSPLSEVASVLGSAAN